MTNLPYLRRKPKSGSLPHPGPSPKGPIIFGLPPSGVKPALDLARGLLEDFEITISRRLGVFLHEKMPAPESRYFEPESELHLRVAGEVVFFVHDGVSDGPKLREKLRAIRELGPSEIIVALQEGTSPLARRLSQSAKVMKCSVTTWQDGLQYQLEKRIPGISRAQARAANFSEASTV